ncbi:hypothetical protein [Acrocarpospora sp. B8E8]|uniref:hypothetical protein n=1 Tax=Acrocarpospora sp. B8E8 TaxID=3153572 RepID=UPI00325E9220
MTLRIFPPDRQQRVIDALKKDITRKKNLNPKRRDRSFPRVVKRARHNSYRVKRPGDVGVRHDGPATVKLANLPKLALAS